MFIEGRHEHTARAVHQDDMDIDTQPEAVKHRHTAEHSQSVSEFETDRLSRLHGAGVEVEVGQADALRQSRGTAAVQYRRGAVLFKADDGR